MSEPPRPAPPPLPGSPTNQAQPFGAEPTARKRFTPKRFTGANYVDFFLYASAAITYVSLSIYNKWLLDWIVGPLWLFAWVWGLPALYKLIRRQPIRPQRGPVGDAE
ncbi:MAG: hypothetical protein QOF59_2028 [Actinomycetota bacterium]|jgi:hypothetical protein|nr:hypothetical protein [Actinomycetota bacterium]